MTNKTNKFIIMDNPLFSSESTKTIERDKIVMFGENEKNKILENADSDIDIPDISVETLISSVKYVGYMAVQRESSFISYLGSEFLNDLREYLESLGISDFEQLSIECQTIDPKNLEGLIPREAIRRMKVQAKNLDIVRCYVFVSFSHESEFQGHNLEKNMGKLIDSGFSNFLSSKKMTSIKSDTFDCERMCILNKTDSFNQISLDYSLEFDPQDFSNDYSVFKKEISKVLGKYHEAYTDIQTSGFNEVFVVEPLYPKNLIELLAEFPNKKKNIINMETKKRTDENEFIEKYVNFEDDITIKLLYDSKVKSNSDSYSPNDEDDYYIIEDGL